MFYTGDKMDDMVNAANAAGGAGVAVGKMAGFAGAGFTMAAVIVMAMTAPPSRKELLVALISTLAFSFGGGGAFVMYMGLQAWANDYFGLLGILGICFVCGLPGWLIVRAGFISAERMKDKDIGEIIAMIRGWLGK